MFCQNRLIGVALTTLLLVGCDSRDPSVVKSNPKPTPTTAPAATQPDALALAATTEPATTQPASQLTVDGQSYPFPAARLRVSKSGKHVVARLYSDDPKAALSDDYKGNSYDLVMELDDITDPQQVYASVWQFKARSRDYADSSHGIFLEGIRYQLEPYNVSAHFLGGILQVRVDLEGEFMQFDQVDASSTPKSVFVRGSLLAPVEYKD